MTANYNVLLTLADITATYTIYYDVVGAGNIAALLGSNLPAQNISYNDITSGVNISVPNSATTITISGDGFCQDGVVFNITPVVIPNTTPELCLTAVDQEKGVSVQISFSPNGQKNGKTKWVSTSPTGYEITWEPIPTIPVFQNLPRWELADASGVGSNYYAVSYNSANVPSNVTWLGNGVLVNINVTENTCSDSISAQLFIQDTICAIAPSSPKSICTGSITFINVVGGTPPYTYSIDNTNYYNSNIFQNLCSNNYIAYVKDSNNTVISLPAFVGFVQNPTQYVLTFNKILRTTINNFQTTATEVTFDYTISPPIPFGTTINFTLDFGEIQQVRLPGTGTTTTNLSLYKNNILLSPSIQNETNVTVNRTDCSNNNSVAFDINQKIKQNLYNISLNYGDTLSGVTTNNLTIPISGGQQLLGCTTILVDNLYYQISNVNILGDDCSEVSVVGESTIFNNNKTATTFGQNKTAMWEIPVTLNGGNIQILVNGTTIVNEVNPSNKYGNFIITPTDVITITGVAPIQNNLTISILRTESPNSTFVRFNDVNVLAGQPFTINNLPVNEFYNFVFSI
jgi:hypothetical protein